MTDLVHHLSHRERLNAPDRLAAVAGTELRQRLDELNAQIADLRERRNKVRAWRDQETAAIIRKIGNARDAIRGLEEWVETLEAQKAYIERPYDEEYERFEDKIMALGKLASAESAKLKMIAGLSDEVVMIAKGGK